MTSITRQQLVDATMLSIELTTDEIDKVPVPPETRQAVMDVALTADRVTKTWWNVIEGCGCLIGTIYGEAVFARLDGHRDQTSERLTRAESCIAGNFPVALHRLGLAQDADWVEPITVVD